MDLVRYCVDLRLPLHPLYQGKGGHQDQKVVFHHYGLDMVAGYSEEFLHLSYQLENPHLSPLFVVLLRLSG